MHIAPRSPFRNSGFPLLLLLGACSSSGIEPRWEELGSTERRQNWSKEQITEASNFRVEIRDTSRQVDSNKNLSFSVGRRNRFGAKGSSSHSLQQTRSFTVLQPGRRSQLVFQGRTYLIELGRAIGARNGSEIEIGIDAVSTQNYATRSGRTRLRVPVGRWFPVWGLNGGEVSGKQNNSINSSLNRERTWQTSSANSGLEIRVSPYGF